MDSIPTNEGLQKHWEPLINLVKLVTPTTLRKAILKNINQTMNCAYSMKTGACKMECLDNMTVCYNDVLIAEINKPESPVIEKAVGEKY